MTSPAKPLQRQPDFLRFWAAQAISDTGARITREGLPMMAVLILAAGPASLGLLSATQSAAGLAVSLAAGGFVDRRPRRPIMISTDLLRALALAALPLAAILHRLSLPLVLIVGGCVAGLSALFEIAHHAYLPRLVPREALAGANARLGVSEGGAELAGPAIAGVLFQTITAPLAVTVNALTYLASAICLATITAREARGQPERRRIGALERLTEGARIVLAHDIARVLLMVSTLTALFGGVFSALYVLFVLKGLGLTPGVLGLGIAFGGASSMAGSVLALPLARRFGVGRAYLATLLVSGLGILPLLLAPHGPPGAVVGLFSQQFLGDFFGVVPIVLGTSLLQISLPTEVQGRVQSVFLSASGLAAIAGAAAGGALGSWLGPRDAMLLAVAGLILAPVLGAFTPLARLRDLPVG